MCGCCKYIEKLHEGLLVEILAIVEGLRLASYYKSSQIDFMLYTSQIEIIVESNYLQAINMINGFTITKKAIGGSDNEHNVKHNITTIYLARW